MEFLDGFHRSLEALPREVQAAPGQPALRAARRDWFQWRPGVAGAPGRRVCESLGAAVVQPQDEPHATGAQHVGWQHWHSQQQRRHRRPQP